MSNIRNNKSNPIDLRLTKVSYYDITLYNGEKVNYCEPETDINDCLVSDIDFNNRESILTRQIKSSVKWSDTTPLPEIKRIPFAGHTMGDNGYYPANYNSTCTLDDNYNTYYQQFSNTKLILNPLRHDTFYMTKVSAPSNIIDYSVELLEDEFIGQYAKLRGGFYQGFYKLHGEDYQTLPNRYSDGFTMLFWLKKDDEPTISTLNDWYPENKGIFFYYGTRAENKFWSKYDGHESCNEDNYPLFTSTKESQYKYTYIDERGVEVTTDLYSKPIYSETDNGFLLYGRNTNSTDDTNKYSWSTIPETKKVFIETKLPYSYPTNPFLVFGRNKWCECDENGVKLGHMSICDVKDNFIRGEAPTSAINETSKDLIDNAYGFRITDNLEFEYRYLTFKDGEVVLVSDKTEPIIPDKQWFSLTVKWVADKHLDEINAVINDKCIEKDYRMGKLMVYINCSLKHVFHNYPEMLLRPLNDLSNRQLAVPYNISLGGGSQGLKHSVTLDGPDTNDSNLLIEQYFAGSFIGNVSRFSIYDCPLDYNKIQELCSLQKERFQPDNVFLSQDEEAELILTDETRRIKIDL